MTERSEFLKINTNWHLTGYYTYGPFMNSALENGSLPFPCAECEASVPGSITNDLVCTGILEPPYYEENTRNQEWIGNRHWVYTNEAVIIPESMHGRRIRLVFRGVDYKAHIFFNGEALGSHTGMFEEFSFDITALAKFDAPNTVRVCLEHTPFEHSYTGYITEKSTVKTHCSYRWDFCARMVDCGIYDDVIITADGGCALEYITPVWDGSTLTVDYGTDSQNYEKMRATLSFEGRTVASSEAVRGEKISLVPKEPKLWYPSGCGEQPMYELTLEPISNVGESQGKFSVECALRKLSYKTFEDAPEGALPYRLFVNDKFIRMDGVNLCPVDLMFGTVDDSRYERLVSQIKAGGFRMVRMWGGGNLERDYFYTLCDRAGIIILHDFLQSNITTCSYPNSDPDFLKFFGGIMRSVARKLSSHPSIVMLSGGNEIRDPATGSTIGMNNPNIAMLKSIAEECIPGILFLPTCGSGPYPLIDVGNLDRYYHDSHGPWMYMGIREHYRIWNEYRSMFNSEFGCNGMTNRSALDKIFSPDKLASSDISEWATRRDIRHHHDGWDTYHRDFEIFGELSLNEYIALSQYIMGESIRYSLEAGRRHDRVNCGMLVWQMNEPWPNSACTNLIDYYGTPKIAYFMAKEALAPEHVSLKYNALVYAPGEEITVTPFVHASEPCKNAKVTLRCGELVREFECMTGEYAIPLEEVIFTSPDNASAFEIKLTLELDGETADEASYLFFVTKEKCDKTVALEYIKKNYKNAEASALI